MRVEWDGKPNFAAIVYWQKVNLIKISHLDRISVTTAAVTARAKRSHMEQVTFLD